jgi:hypothetical protein
VVLYYRQRKAPVPIDTEAIFIVERLYLIRAMASLRFSHTGCPIAYVRGARPPLLSIQFGGTGLIHYVTKLVVIKELPLVSHFDIYSKVGLTLTGGGDTAQKTPPT